MSDLSVNSILDADGGATTTINGYTPTVSNMAGRNKIINGDFRIDQRNAGAAVTGIASTRYLIDRFVLNIGGNGTFSAQQSAVAPSGFANSQLFSCTATGGPAVMYFGQRVEGFNLQDLAYNTASAKTITVSFWVRSNKTGTFVLLVSNTSTSRDIGKTYTIDVANTWELKTLSFVGDTASAIPNTTAIGLELKFWLSAGAGWTSGTLPATWTAQLTANEAAGQTVNLADSTLNTFYITGVQLEAGSVATPFEHRQYGQELALCKRYHRRIIAGNSGTGAIVGLAGQVSTVSSFVYIALVPSMRATPTVTFASLIVSDSSSLDATVSTFGTVIGNEDAMYLQCNHGALGALGNAVNLRGLSNTAAAHLSFTAEL
jgi:hypothetical protein